VNSKHRKPLVAVFREPVAAAIEWSAIEGLLVAVGCSVIEGSGSWVRFVHGVLVISFHRPHPAKEAKRYQVRDARGFLIKIGVQP
jgi:hypothetical protein